MLNRTIVFVLLTISQLLVVCTCLFSQNIHGKNDENLLNQHPKNIILMIGDGMGLNQIYEAMNAERSMSAATTNFNILRFKQIAFAETKSADNKITDSAAGGTAIATGTKTNNGYLGVDTNNVPVKSILKYAEDNGLSTGLVVTCDVTHATPASFIANVQSRNQADEIARQFLYTDIEVFIGGGYNSFSVRTDKINYVDSLKAHKYNVVTSLDELKLAKAKGKLAGLLYAGHAPKFSEGRGDMLSIATSKAIDILDNNSKGFFLMIEGSQIDWGGHDNNTDYMVAELLDFDKAIGIALDYAAKNPETLVIVTADHETGGLTLVENDAEKGEMKTSFSTTHHTASPVPVFAMGPGSERFSGFIDNTDIFKIMMSLYKFKK